MAGIILGVFLNELLRRRSRIESFSSTVFERRLGIYEELFKKIQAAYQIATDLIENPAYSKEQRHDIVSDAILDIASFCDENDLFIDSDLVAHCTALLMGVEVIFHMTDEAEKQKAIHDFRDEYANTKRIIAEDSGVQQVNALFKSIAKPKLSSPIIDRINELREEKREQEGQNISG